MERPESTVQAHSLPVTRTARYYTAGPAAGATHRWWVLHGYGQLAQYFMQNFLSLAQQGTFIIAPEALSRFYLNEQYSRVGASWMTREDREAELADQLGYLQLLYAELPPLPPLQQVVLGFSQGGATAWRWVQQWPTPPSHLVLWGSAVPTDATPAQVQHLRRHGCQVWLALGDADPFLTPERRTEQEQLWHSLGLQPQLFTYPADHRIPPEALLGLVHAMKLH